MDIFNEFYVAMKDGRLMAPSYDLTFTEVNTGETFQLKGYWNKRESLKIKMGNYSVRGTSTAEGKYIQEKCSIIINDPEVVIDRDDTIINLQASYDCALVIFADSSISSVENQTGDESSEFFKFGEHYLYAFVNDSIWDGISDSCLFCTRNNGSEFSIPTNYQPFEKGKFYIYNTDKTSFFEIGLTLPEMEEGDILYTQSANEIWYTSTDGNIVTPISHQKDAELFGANIISNTYHNGLGIIKFDGAVTKIADSAFWFERTLKSICIPEEVVFIDDNSFGGCENLAQFSGKFASEDGHSLIVDNELIATATAGLIEYAVPTGVTTIKDCAFWNRNTLEKVTIPDSVIDIEEGAFDSCSKLKEFEGKFASADARCLIVDDVLISFAPLGLTEYTIPDGVCRIGDWAFEECTNLTSLTIPDGVASIGWYAFGSCSGLTSITIPDSVTKIEGNAFYGCSSLESITIPNGIISISDAFIYCSSLKEFKSEFASSDGRCLIFNGELIYFAPAGLTEYTIPDNVTKIGSYAFHECLLTSVSIPNSVTNIGWCAFSNCDNLVSVTIPESVTHINYGAFNGCDNLVDVYCKPTTPPTAGFANKEWSGFSGNASMGKIYVPDESVEAYRGAEGWNEYANDIVGYDFE